MLQKTIDREAFSETKLKALEIDFIKDATALRPEFASAQTDEALYRAIVHFSNLRKDPHLKITRVKKGLEVNTKLTFAPIEITPDFQQGGYFLTNWGQQIKTEKRLEIGDQLTLINGQSIEEMEQHLSPYLSYSTNNHKYWQISKLITSRNVLRKHLFPKEVLSLTFAKDDSSTYNLKVNYQEKINWTQDLWRNFENYELVLHRINYDLYVPKDKKNHILLDLYRMRSTDIESEMRELATFAKKEGLLNQHVILDLTNCPGGSKGAVVLSYLSSKSFKTTFGNFKCSAISRKLARQTAKRKSLRKWIRAENRAVCDHQEYSREVPFKLALHSEESEGIMAPNEVHFQAGFSVISSSRRGSHVDQVLAMIKDNQLAKITGMPSAGFSNTWEWNETLRFPDGKKACNFMWSVGQTIRPNGQILDGNPAQVDFPLLLSREGYRSYYQALIELALEAHFKEQSL